MKGNPKGAIIEKSKQIHPVYLPLQLDVPPPHTKEEFELWRTVAPTIHFGEFMRRWRIQKNIDLILFESEMERRRKSEDAN